MAMTYVLFRVLLVLIKALIIIHFINKFKD